MLWLIWIAMMLLVPMAAGAHVWFQLRYEQPDPATTSAGAGTSELPPVA
jgi:hypothetical protein